MSQIERKRRTREHIIADLSVNHVERFVLQCGYVVERYARDYGIDLRMVTFNRRGELEEWPVQIQLKATDRMPMVQEGRMATCRIQRRDLVSWLAQPFPVILIAYDAKTERAFWVYVQSHFRQRKEFNIFSAGATITVRFPIENVVNKAAVRRFTRFRDRALAQMEDISHEED